MKRKLFIDLISSLFILLFVYTALSKLYNFHSFKTVLVASPLIGDKAGWIAWAVPISELIAALLLFFPKTKLVGLCASLVLMSVFTIYLAYMIIFEPHLPCTCGGVIQQMSWKQHLIFNVVFTILAFLGIRLKRKSLSKNHEMEAPPVVFT